MLILSYRIQIFQNSIFTKDEIRFYRDRNFRFGYFSRKTMKLDKVIFSVDDNPIYADFWKIQADLVKTILKADPVLFYITDEDSDFYFDGHGIVKKIKSRYK